MTPVPAIDPETCQREAARLHHALRAPAKPAQPSAKKATPRPIITPKDFLRLRCRQLGVEYEVLLSQKQERRLVNARHQLIGEVYAAYPKLSLAAVGRLFSRHAKTIAYVMKSRGYQTRHSIRPTAEQRAHALRLVAEGLSIRAAARTAGVNHGSVRVWLAASKDGK